MNRLHCVALSCAALSTLSQGCTSKGATGATGPQGIPGSFGATGAVGPTGTFAPLDRSVITLNSCTSVGGSPREYDINTTASGTDTWDCFSNAANQSLGSACTSMPITIENATGNVELACSDSMTSAFQVGVVCCSESVGTCIIQTISCAPP